MLLVILNEVNVILSEDNVILSAAKNLPRVQERPFCTPNPSISPLGKQTTAPAHHAAFKPLPVSKKAPPAHHSPIGRSGYPLSGLSIPRVCPSAHPPLSRARHPLA